MAVRIMSTNGPGAVKKLSLPPFSNATVKRAETPALSSRRRISACRLSSE
jgi:hypothetical protein